MTEDNKTDGKVDGEKSEDNKTDGKEDGKKSEDNIAEKDKSEDNKADEKSGSIKIDEKILQEKPAKNTKSNASPKTGVSSSLGYIGLLTASALALLKKKKNKINN